MRHGVLEDHARSLREAEQNDLLGRQGQRGQPLEHVVDHHKRRREGGFVVRDGIAERVRVPALFARLGGGVKKLWLVEGLGQFQHVMGAGAASMQHDHAAPEAREQSWYPHSFSDPISDNEPAFTSALVVIDDMLKGLSALALPPEQIILLGFSQGACMILEYAVRNPRRYGGLVGLSGCLLSDPTTRRSRLRDRS